mgnify:CR=1 FL=1
MASSIAGRGLIADPAIDKGHVVAVKGGHVIDLETLRANEELIGDSYLQIADGLVLAPLSPEEVEEVMMFLNHSCEPNCGVRGEITFVAMRDIAPGEELTIDYAMIDDDAEERMECRCGTPSCRGVITGKDWEKPELQEKYGRYFSSYILAKIEGGRV